MEKIKRFSGKNIQIEIYIDETFRPYSDGVPQYRSICTFDGKVVYDDKLKIEEINWSDVNNLKNYAVSIGAYNKRINAYNCFDLTCVFRVVED